MRAISSSSSSSCNLTALVDDCAVRAAERWRAEAQIASDVDPESEGLESPNLDFCLHTGSDFQRNAAVRDVRL
jgi:hypothetical protein